MHLRILAGSLFLLTLGLAQDAETRTADVRTLQAAGVGIDNPGLLAFFKSRTANKEDKEKIALRIKQLGDDDFEVRETASADLVKIGLPAVALLKPATNSADAEVARRARECLHQIDQREKNAGVLASAAARLLAERKPAGTAVTLFDFLATADAKDDVAEVELALAAVALREGKAEQVLVAALTSKEPRLRGLAGGALGRSGAERETVRGLLGDADPAVQLRVALALATAKEKDAVPVLIDLLGQLPPDQVWPAENLLQRLAGEKSPAVTLGTDLTSRAKCRDAWAGWWRDNAATADLAALTRQPTHLGYTLVVCPDGGGQVQELGRDGTPRWKVTGLQSPFAAEVLPGDRFLVAEYSGRVTERNIKGEVLWQKQIQLPLQCQRLPNGSTFIVTTRNVIEIDPAGKESVVYDHSGNKGSSIVAGQKLPNGQVVVTASDGACVRFDGTGKEVSRFSVGRISNNCLRVLPNGNCLVARYFDGLVLEYDREGKVVWEAKVPSAFAPWRLPNGNTLVACNGTARVVELDRTGAIVREFKGETANHHPWFTSGR